MQQPMPIPAAPPVVAPEPHVLKAPAARARKIGVVLSAIAVLFAFVFGFFIRKAFALRADPDAAFQPFFVALILLLFALLFRMAAAMCELLWLERTWSNLPADLRKVGPIDKVNSGLVLVVSFVPGVAWLWKLGVVVGIADGFESLRPKLQFKAPVPRKLGIAAVITGWVPGLNVYVAPFLWEMFAMRMERVINELMAARDGTMT